MADRFKNISLGLVKEVAGLAEDALIGLTPISAVARVMGKILNRPDLEQVTTRAILDGQVQLYERIIREVSRLDDEMRAKIDPEEAMILIAQGMEDMNRKASAKHRKLIANVVANGFRPDASLAKARHFEHVLARLTPDHIKILLEYVNIESPEHGDPVRRSLVLELAALQLLDGQHVYQSITDLGREFLRYAMRDETPAADDAPAVVHWTAGTNVGIVFGCGPIAPAGTRPNEHTRDPLAVTCPACITNLKAAGHIGIEETLG